MKGSQKRGTREAQKRAIDNAVAAALSAGDSAELFKNSIDEQLQALTATGSVSPPVPKQRQSLKFADLDQGSHISDTEQAAFAAASYDNDDAADAEMKSASSYGRYLNMNMSIRMPSTEDASLQAGEDRAAELGLDSAR